MIVVPACRVPVVIFPAVSESMTCDPMLRCVHVADEEVVVRAVVDGQHNVCAAEGFRLGEVRRRVVRADGNVR